MPLRQAPSMVGRPWGVLLCCKVGPQPEINRGLLRRGHDPRLLQGLDAAVYRLLRSGQEQRAMKRERRAQGLCILCGEAPADEGVDDCEQCHYENWAF